MQMTLLGTELGVRSIFITAVIRPDIFPILTGGVKICQVNQFSGLPIEVGDHSLQLAGIAFPGSIVRLAFIAVLDWHHCTGDSAIPNMGWYRPAIREEKHKRPRSTSAVESGWSSSSEYTQCRNNPTRIGVVTEIQPTMH